MAIKVTGCGKMLLSDVSQQRHMVNCPLERFTGQGKENTQKKARNRTNQEKTVKGCKK